MNWLRATPSLEDTRLASSSSEDCRRRATLFLLMSRGIPLANNQYQTSELMWSNKFALGTREHFFFQMAVAPQRIERQIHRDNHEVLSHSAAVGEVKLH